MKPTRLKLVERTDMRPVASTGRKANKTYRTREHLTEAEMTKLLDRPEGEPARSSGLADRTVDLQARPACERSL